MTLTLQKPATYVNVVFQEDDPDDWELTSRFYLVDRVSAVPTSQFAASLAEARPKAVRYLSKMELRIEMLDTRENPEKAGRIYPPVAVIEYGEVSIDDLARGKEVEFEFSVKYKMEMREAKKDIGVRGFQMMLSNSIQHPRTYVIIF